MTKHAIERAKERYGLDLDESALGRISIDIRAGKSLLCHTAPDGAEHRIVQVGSIVARVIYRPDTCAILTFLPAKIKKARHRRAK